jgi:hypothetical protein
MITPIRGARKTLDFPTSATTPDAGIASALAQRQRMNDSQSPSLATDAQARSNAKEVKFVLCEETAVEVERRIAESFAPDPHCIGGTGYQLASIYCDNPTWDVYYRRGRCRYCKFRVRRYDQADVAHLERKVKKGYQVRKKRCELPVSSLSELETPTNRLNQSVYKYRSQLTRQTMRPVCLIRYERTAYFGAIDTQPVRMTFDRHICGQRWNQWSFDSSDTNSELLPNLVVCEFKFRGSMPTALKELAHQFSLTPTGLSKYRRCVEQVALITPFQVNE